MKNKFLLIIASFLFFFQFSFQLKAQQLPLFTQYQETASIANPSLLSGNYLRYDMNANVNAVYRYQWTKVDGSPRTGIINFDMFDDYKHILLGGAITQDQTGPTGYMGVYGRFAYHFALNRDMFVLAGLNFGAVQYRVKGHELYFLEEDDNANTDIAQIKPDFAVGATWYYAPFQDKKFHFGISIPQTFGLELNFNDANNNFNFDRVKHYYANGGMDLEIKNDSWVSLSTWVKYVENAPLHFDINFRYEHQRILWFGFGASFPGAVHFETGVNILQGSTSDNRILRFGYGFDYFYNSYGPYFGTAHEIKISYAWWFDEF